ncbi:MAG: hypothetical protein AAF591_12840 [Verrucomicrobiota bacterium]
MKSRPWLYIVFAFVLLITVWTVFITIALKNQPASIPLDSATPSQQAQATRS